MLDKVLGSIVTRRKRQALEARSPTVAKIRTIVPKCLVCNADLASHRFAQVASMSWGEETQSRVRELFFHVKNHEWESLIDYREFRPDQDDVIAYAVTGPHEGGMVVLIRDPVELYARVEEYLEEAITAEEVKRIKGLTADNEWKDL